MEGKDGVRGFVSACTLFLPSAVEPWASPRVGTSHPGVSIGPWILIPWLECSAGPRC